MGRLRPPWLAALGVFGAVLVLVLERAARGVQPYGVNGAAWIEHAERLAFVQAWRARDTLTMSAWLDEIDGLFPPGLHAITSLIGAVVGHAPGDVVWTGALWLLLFCGALAGCARALGAGTVGQAAAFGGAALLPSAHAFAARYYYDLPMTALLWVGVAVAVATWERRPIVGGLTVGAIWLAADLVKWAALPFGGLLLVGAAAACWRGRWRPALALGLATLVSAGGSGAWIAAAGGESSLGVMLEQMWGGSSDGGLGGIRAWVADKGVLVGNRFSLDRVAFYAVGAVTTVLSVAWTLPVVGLAATVRDRRALVVGLLGPLLLVVFLLLWIPILDERFLLTAVPGLIVLAALGLETRQRPAIWAAVAVVLGLIVGAAFHGHVLDDDLWGAGLRDSVERRGWSSASSTPDPRADLRESVYAAIAAESPRMVAVPDAPQHLAPAGEFHWLDYRSLLDEIEHDRPVFDFVESCSPDADVSLAPTNAPCPGTELARFPGVVLTH